MTADTPKLLDPATISETVAMRIRHYRKTRGLSIRELAVKCAEFAPDGGLTQGSLTNIERFDPNGLRPRREVNVGDLIILATVLDVPILDFLVEAPICRNCQGNPPDGFECRACGALGGAR